MTTPAPAVATLPADPKLVQLRRLARLLDSQFRLPGTSFRFGLDAVVGLIPGFGDVAGAIASLAFLIQGARMGASRSVLARMVGNIVTEMLIGAVPGIGDIFDAVFKANNRNLRLLERLAAAPEETHRASARFLVWTAITVGVFLLVVGVAAVIIGVLAVRFILQGRGPLQ